AAVSLYVGHFNLCRVHEALRITPGMAMGITDHIWTIGELIDAATAEPVKRWAAEVIGCPNSDARVSELGQHPMDASGRRPRELAQLRQQHGGSDFGSRAAQAELPGRAEQRSAAPGDRQHRCQHPGGTTAAWDTSSVGRDHAMPRCSERAMVRD